MKSYKNNFLVKNVNSNSFLKKNEIMKKSIKIKMIKKDSMYDKINNHFKSYDFAKLQLLGEDNSNYGDFIFEGYVYKPKNIKVEYLGNKDINSDLLIKNKLFKKSNYSIYKTKNKNISFINPISYNKEKNYKSVLKDKYFTSLDIELPMIPKIHKSNYEENKDKDKNNSNCDINKNEVENIIKDNIRNNDFLKISKSYSKIKGINKNDNFRINNKNMDLKNVNMKSYLNIPTKLILKNINIYNLKAKLKNRIELLENKVNNSSKFILNGSKINEEEKPQFKLRFNNLRHNFNKYLE